MRVVAASDWVIDIGPGAGDEGGRIVAAATPADLAASPGTAPQSTWLNFFPCGRHTVAFLHGLREGAQGFARPAGPWNNKIRTTPPSPAEGGGDEGTVNL